MFDFITAENFLDFISDVENKIIKKYEEKYWEITRFQFFSLLDLEKILKEAKWRQIKRDKPDWQWWNIYFYWKIDENFDFDSFVSDLFDFNYKDFLIWYEKVLNSEIE